jgi:hypothetical protein
MSKFEKGLATWSDPGADKPLLEIPTFRCVHCGGAFAIEPGSGKIRGFCTNCNGYVCGPGCKDCVPMEQLLENLEAGRELTFRPVVGNVPKLWTPDA